MASLLHSLLITLSTLTVLQILLQPLPPLSHETQIPGQDESNGEVHLDVRQSDFVAEQEFPAALLELCSHEVQIVVDVLGQPFLGLFGVTCMLVPTGVHDRNAVQSKCPLGCMHPLQDD